MVQDTVALFSNIARNKADFLKSSLGKYFLLSMLAGIYVGFGIVLIFSIGAPLKDLSSPFVKALMGASFGVALTLVIFAGSELFTGNNMVMTIGLLEKKVSKYELYGIWFVSYIGNLVGSLLLALTVAHSGIISNPIANSFITATASAKMSAPFIELFLRGILCNMLVCLAVWCSGRTKEDVAKLVLIFWCLFAFIGSGLEHSVANMTLLGMGLFIPHEASVSWLGFFQNLIPVTLGNIVGGAINMGAAYWYIASTPKEDR